MKNNKYLVVSIVVALALSVYALIVVLSGGADGQNGRNGLNGKGAIPGPEVYETMIFRGSSLDGGITTSTTTVDATIVLDASHLRREVSYISMNIGVNATVTTMASTSAPLVDLLPGQSFQVYFYNASTTAGSTATFAGGTGVDLQEDEGATVIVNGLEVARLTFLKKLDSDVIFWVETGQVGD